MWQPTGWHHVDRDSSRHSEGGAQAVCPRQGSRGAALRGRLRRRAAPRRGPSSGVRTSVAALSRRRRGAESSADILVDLLVGESPETQVTEQLVSRYERYIACARQPGLRDVQRRILQQRTDAVAEVVERSGRAVHAELVTALVCAVDGAVGASLVDDGDGPRESARATLIDVIDVLAPVDDRVLHV